MSPDFRSNLKSALLSRTKLAHPMKHGRSRGWLREHVEAAANEHNCFHALAGTRQTLTYDAPTLTAQLLTQPSPIYSQVHLGEAQFTSLTCFGHSPTSVLPDRRRHLGPDVPAIASTPHDLPFPSQGFFFLLSLFDRSAWGEEGGSAASDWMALLDTAVLLVELSPLFLALSVPPLNSIVRRLARRRPHGPRQWLVKLYFSLPSC